jgi:hypothetical protein
MSPLKGPHRRESNRLATARALPLARPQLSAEALRRYLASVPLRRPANPAAPRSPTQTITTAEVEQAVAAMTRGEGMNLTPEEDKLALRIAPVSQAVLQQSRLSPQEIQRLFAGLRHTLIAPEKAASLPRWRERADAFLHQVILGTPNGTHVFTFVLVPRPEQGVIVAACEHYCSHAR